MGIAWHNYIMTKREISLNVYRLKWKKYHEVPHWERDQFICFISFREEWNDVRYIYYFIELFHIYLTSFHSSREDVNSINWPRSHAKWGSLAQLVEHRKICTAGVAGSNPVKALIFQASSFQLLKSENLQQRSFFTFRNKLSFGTIYLHLVCLRQQRIVWYSNCYSRADLLLA